MVTRSMATEPAHFEVSSDALRRLGISRRKWSTLSPAEKIGLLAERVERDGEKRQQHLAMPEEPKGTGADDQPVLWFAKTFGRDGERYEYVTHRVEGKGWRISTNATAVVGAAALRVGNRERYYYTWAEVWEFITRRESAVPQVWIATGWETI